MKSFVIVILLGFFALQAFASDGYIFNAVKNVNYELNRALQVDDVITAWGVYKDDSTSKFSVNIQSSNNQYLLHVDFRPYDDVVVLNSYTSSWQTEIRPVFSKNNFQANKMFSVRIEVHATEYRIFYNGNELARRFPHRIRIEQAAYVTLRGGSNGFQWSALHLPDSILALPGIPFSTSSGVKNYLDSELVPGDVITAWGIYATGSAKFTVNLMKENGQYFMIHVDFRPPPNENKVVLNSKKQNGWEQEIRTPIPSFVNGKAFKVEVKCYLDEFEIFVDGNVLESGFPYRDGFSLSDVKFVWLLGGSNGTVWTDIALPPSYNLRHFKDGIIFNAVKNVNYELMRALKVNDVITAWGVYKDHSTSKFSINIRASNTKYLLHVDFRPYDDVVVLNSYTSSWQTEIRPAFSKNNFQANTMFSVRIEVHATEYRIFFNGNELARRFPHRIRIEQAAHVTLHGGSNGFQWSALHLPDSILAGPGIPFSTSSGVKNYLDRELVAGDVITAWGIYATESSKFNVNLMNENDQHFMIHVDFQPPPSENKVVLNSKKQNGWELEIRTPIPTFVNGKVFRVDVKCHLDEFEIFVSGKVLESRFPYRDGFSLSEVKFVWLLGGSNGMVWTDLALPTSDILGVRLEGVRATQSSTGWNGAPERAIDGNENGEWSSSSCQHSLVSKNNWWTMTLAEISAVNKVIIYNRVDCCYERINGAKVYVGDVFCGEVVYEVGNVVYEIECSGAVGSTVRVVQNDNYLTLCEVKVFGRPSDETLLVNIAPGFPTWQSSEGSGGSSGRATDERSNGMWEDGSCSHTATTDFNMWKVDLIDKYEINQVVIHNRLDCCRERLDGTEVYVDDFLCGAIEYATGKNVYVVDCGGKTGSAIKITNKGILTLCEVEVLVRPSEKDGKLINVASSGVATQDSTGWDGVASKAIDGIVSGSFFEGNSCSHNGDLTDGWWNLEFPEPTPVEKVIIYNREDCCEDRINKVKVYADDMLCGTINFEEGQTVYKVGCASDTTEYTIATNIRVTAAEGTYLTLCEVQVLSDPNAMLGNLVNLAYLKPTKQSSVGFEGISSRAVDGRESGKWSQRTCTHTNGPGSWFVDLEDNYVVERVWIRNRVDCCSERIDGVKVYVGDILCGTIEYNRMIYSYDLVCGDGNGIVGNSVKIYNDKTHLTLCEVKVYGNGDPVFISTDKEVIADESGSDDDAQSRATCPVGYVVSYCEAQSGQVHDTCDGAFVDPNNGGVCVAVNGYQGTGAIARAVCSQTEQTSDPCNGPNLPKYKNLHSRGPSPSLECSAGYEQVVCNARSPWRGKLTDKVDEKGVIPNGATCAVSGCTVGNWCEVTAVCKLIDDMDVYTATVCPSCDGYHCGEGEECELLDVDDDDEDAEQPVCVEKMTGCDNNARCGEGECIAVGSDGYVCDCADGFEFNAVTGSCIPIHTIWKTVFGEKAVGDDAISYAECESGEVVMRCHTYGAPSAADGVYITTGEDGISKCIARASHNRKYPIIAIAYCGSRATITDPCTQQTIHSTEYRFISSLSPSVSCPGGYYMESCIFHSPWTQSMTDAAKAKISSIGSVDVNADGFCSVENCLKGPVDVTHYCKLTAVCTKLTGDEYVRDACPTCDQVRCPGDQICGIVNELPVCQPRIPGGCETDKCGPGTCIEHGASYSCDCNSGYLFNGVVCQDVNECAEELPCGNGDCSNSPGSYSCECNEGYENARGTCIDLNECTGTPCSNSERCSNIEGSYICDCLDKFISVSDECVCADGFENASGNCVDVNECADGTACGENEDCFNTEGNFNCKCSGGFERGNDGVCKDFSPGDCYVRPKNGNIMSIAGNKVVVKLLGVAKKTLYEYATITWLKNNEPWDPSADGKDKFNGFTLWNFAAEDAGLYVGNIYIEKSERENYKCSASLTISLKEGSATITIEDSEKFADTQKAGIDTELICDVELTNVKLNGKNDRNDIIWYKGDIIMKNTTVTINKKKRIYRSRLSFQNPGADDSGTYKCEFSRQRITASTDISIMWA